MVHAILYIIPVFLVYLYIRSCWVSNETLKTQYKIARLKDELKWLCITGEINSESKAYTQLCKNMEKTGMGLHRFSFWVILYLLIKGKDQVNITETEKVWEVAEDNSTFSNIFDA